MKNSIKLAAAAASLLFGLITSCVSISPQKPDPINPGEDQAPARFVPYETLHVDVPDSTYCVVYKGNVKIATCYKSGDIIVPKARATKADAEDYTIVKVATGHPATDITSKNTMDMVVAFEDTKNGDHDYNDIIFQARLEITNKENGNNEILAEITPIAYGAAKNIGLGIALAGADNTIIAEKVITENCRQALFGNDQGFINTGRNGSRKKYSPIKYNLTTSVNGSVSGISWFIKVGDEKLYASNTFRACLDNADMPQGLVLLSIRPDKYFFMEDGVKYNCGNDFWQYPYESVNISKVYPDFENAFITRGDFTCLGTPQSKDYFDAIADVKDEIFPDICLYTVKSSGGEEAPAADAVQLWTGGPKWATCNLGAESPEDYGFFFQWGNIDGHKCPGEICDYKFKYNFYNNGYFDSTTGGSLTDSFTSGDITFDAARFIWGGDWRMPTSAEVQDLLKHTTYTLVEDYKGTGVRGGLFTSKEDSTKSIFFPAAGVIDGAVHKGYGKTGTGHYWTTNIDGTSDKSARTLRTGEKTNPSNYGRNSALPIRAVCD